MSDFVLSSSFGGGPETLPVGSPLGIVSLGRNEDRRGRGTNIGLWEAPLRAIVDMNVVFDVGEEFNNTVSIS